jgi:hypothetical protein
MIEASDDLPAGTDLPDNPPSLVLLGARRQATAAARCVYVYRLGPDWIVTRDLAEPPAELAVWMIPANQNLPRHAGR